ncbi:HET-domain-containing protein [Xylariaceae sp. FL0255]|nr:HET-domain-containing protein [Xylariaceae sp. FL0255]
MAQRCILCLGFSINHLVELAKIEFSSRSVPQKAFYQHHASMDDLERSAAGGCDFCTLIYECFRYTPTILDNHPKWPEQWSVDLPFEKSMLADTKYFKETDIKVFIDSSSLYFGEKLDSAPVFDILQIHIGRVPAPPMESPVYDEDVWNWDPLTLVISTPPTTPCLVGGFQIGRQYCDPDLSSKANFDISRRWLSTCQHEHERCLGNHVPKLPARVIDVMDLKLVETRGQSVPYMALSHCWGSRESAILLRENLDALKRAIHFESLPSNFQDAITITRELGIQYLWIDSICIIQKSKEDWEVEAKKMGQYYGNSTLTLCAAAAENSTVGILKPAIERLTRIDEDLQDLYIRGPWTSRGWTLQESILSPRHLYFGRHHTYWKCLDGYKCNDGLPEGRRTPEDKFLALRQALFGSILAQPTGIGASRDEVLRDYYRLVEQYSARKLSYDSDKLPAFSGLAQLMHSSIGGQYMAGLWSSDLHIGLTWYREMRTCRHVSEYRAPWSWAVTNESVVIYINKFQDNGYRLKVHDCNIVQRDLSNPYGEVSGGHIYVRGLVKALFIKPGKRSSGGDYKIFRAEIDDEASLLAMNWQNNGDGGHDVDFGLLLPETYTVLIIGTMESAYHEDILVSVGLILRETQLGNQQVFERVGLLTNLDCDPTWLSGWEERDMKLV